MEFDDFAKDAAEAIKSAANQADRPAISKLEARRRRQNLLNASLSAILIIVGLATVVLWPDPGVPPVASGSTPTSEPPTTKPPATSTTHGATTTSLPAAFAAIRSDIGLGWESVELPEIVAFCHQAVIPTDDEIVLWGGNQASCEYDSPIEDPGLAYNTDTGTWRQLSSGPLQPAVAPTGVWTGEEVLICCGIEGIAPVGGGEIGSNQAAAYDPKTDAWRTLPDAPLGGPFPMSVWTGSEMIVVAQSGVASYNPTSDTWRSYSQPPESIGRVNDVVWTGTEVVVWPVWPAGEVQRQVLKGIALDPTTDNWRILPDPPAWPAALDMVTTGDSLIIWGGLPANSGGSERAVGSRYDLGTNTWTVLPEALPEPDACECNLGTQTLTWTGEFVLVSPGWFSTGVDPDTPVLLAYHPDTNGWILVDEESPVAWGGNSFSVGERLAMVADRVIYVSPVNWQPTGEAITESTWDN